MGSAAARRWGGGGPGRAGRGAPPTGLRRRAAVLELEHGQITTIHNYLNTELLPAFGPPMRLEA